MFPSLKKDMHNVGNVRICAHLDRKFRVRGGTTMQLVNSTPSFDNLGRAGNPRQAMGPNCESIKGPGGFLGYPPFRVLYQLSEEKTNQDKQTPHVGETAPRAT